MDSTIKKCILIFAVCCIILLMLLVILTIYNIYRSYINQKQQFELMMEKARVAGNPKINSLSYKELQEIVNQLINFYVTSIFSTSNVRSKPPDELSIILDTMIIDVCANVKISLSTEILNAFSAYVSDDFLNHYIKDLTRALLLAKIENSRDKK